MKTTALIKTDFCPGCNSLENTDGYSVHLIDLPIAINKKSYAKVCVSLCPNCDRERNAESIRRNLTHALLEGYLF